MFVNNSHATLDFSVKKDKKEGVINKTNDIVVPFEYDYGDTIYPGIKYECITNFNGTLALARKDNKWGILEIEKG